MPVWTLRRLLLLLPKVYLIHSPSLVYTALFHHYYLSCFTRAPFYLSCDVCLEASSEASSCPTVWSYLLHAVLCTTDSTVVHSNIHTNASTVQFINYSHWSDLYFIMFFAKILHFTGHFTVAQILQGKGQFCGLPHLHVTALCRSGAQFTKYLTIYRKIVVSVS